MLYKQVEQGVRFPGEDDQVMNSPWRKVWYVAMMEKAKVMVGERRF